MHQIVEIDEGTGSSCNDSDPQFHLESQPQQHVQQITQFTRTLSSTDLVSCGGTIGPIITWNEVCMGDLIASGSFASVYKVSLAGLVSPTVKTAQAKNRDLHINNSGGVEDVDMTSDLLFGDEDGNEYHGALVTSSHHSHHSQTTTPITQKPYALKKLNKAIFDVPIKLNHGIKGMIFEAQLLSQILPQQQNGRTHPNIVRMHGMSPNFMEDPVSGFLILERLVETLDSRLKRWLNRQTMMLNNERHTNDQQHHLNMFSYHRFFDAHHSQKRNTTLKEQLTRTKYIGFGIASAIKYLHEHHILYRDLKPSNVGFDDSGIVKIFDFDLSRRFQYDASDDSGVAAKQLTACIGSFRYMSPECALGKPYGFSSDVYSFAILLWEICTLQRPFEKVDTVEELLKAAYVGNGRPTLRSIVSPTIKQLLQTSWHPNPDVRPTMASIVDTLHSLHSSSCDRRNRDSPRSLRKLISRRKNGN